ncbi:hypothetical protein AB5J49_15095 [Streptomyces sp. R28]|uniref:Uncharacterized protein n=1 Tax=Streptomyces sp. R28 TaxID=3238628 RepID=A0AB39PUA1_9ACTN
MDHIPDGVLVGLHQLCDHRHPRRLLGVCQTTADTWRRITTGEHASYAAQLARR